MEPKRRILIVDDEDHIVELLVMHLHQHGFATSTALDGRSVMECVLQDLPDLILLDLMLPGIGGLEVCRKLKQDVRTAGIPVIMLTAKSEESDKVIGLGIGADDYITKPFGLRELVARIESVLRRCSSIRTDNATGRNLVRCGNLVLDVEGHVVSVNGEPVAFSPTEFAILSELASHAGTTVLRDDLASVGAIESGPKANRVLDVHILNIRRKLGQFEHAGLTLETVRGFGYLLHGR